MTRRHRVSQNEEIHYGYYPQRNQYRNPQRNQRHH